MKRIKTIRLFPLLVTLTLIVLCQANAFSQSSAPGPNTVTLLARTKVGELDNYTQTAFSFKYGINGQAALRVTRNNWDLVFGNSSLPDAFDVSMVVDDCSRIKDLGALTWGDKVNVPALPSYSEPTREPSVKAIVGHMYVVHTKDRDNDHFALFRVEALEPSNSVTITWKLIPAPR